MGDITSSINSKSELKNEAADLGVEVTSLMSWKIKAHSHWIFPLDAGMGIFTAISITIYLWVCFFMEKPIASGIDDVIFVAPLTCLFVWWSWRKKTVWNYTITSEGGHVEYWEDYFENTKYVFRGLAVFAVVCILTMIAIAPELIWMIAGVGGMVILAAAKLASWENEIEWKSFTWDRPQCIFIDRKRRLVVLERNFDPDVPFWENYLYVQVFLPKERFDEFLALCKEYAPADVEYEEGEFRE